MPTRQVELSEHLDRFVEGRITSGNFGSVSEVVVEGLRLSEFGQAASVRYKALLNHALRDIEADPLRPGAQARPDLMISEAKTSSVWHCVPFNPTPEREPIRSRPCRRAHTPMSILIRRACHRHWCATLRSNGVAA